VCIDNEKQTTASRSCRSFAVAPKVELT